MTNIAYDELNELDVVYYIPPHKDKTPENGERGVVKKKKDGKVWVRFLGPDGELTPLKDLYK